MSARRVGREALKGFITGLMEDGRTVWGPQEFQGSVRFRPLKKNGTPVLDVPNATLSPKEVVFPPSEWMFLFSTDPGREDAFVLKEVPQEGPEQVILGIRPCDARAFQILDRVFLEQGAHEDPYYRSKRDRTLLIGLGCNTPCSTCFCHWTGGGPFHTEGLDVLMTDLGDVYLLEPVTERGRALLDALQLDEAGADEVERGKHIAEEARASMGEAKDPRRIKEKDLMALFGSPFWERAHEACVKCGVCTYLCPTCSCFDIQDEVRGACGFRGRNWDTCMFALTTLHASGHNPRPTGKERFRQRFMHKLKYFQDDFGDVMCVGCGRCVQYCPANIDIREIIEALSA